MPIHLPPISRRQFLNRTLAASATLLLPSRLFAEARSADPSSWALISDTHVAADPARILRETNMSDNLAAVVKEVVSMARPPGAAIISGDLALSQGEPGDYSTLVKLLEPLRRAPMPVHLALGNHDHRENFWNGVRAEETVARPVEERHVALLRSPRANWFMLDSLDITLATPGTLGAAQLAWLTKSLDANPGKPALIVIHHNPNLTGENKGALTDTKELFEIIRPRKQVKAYVFGHSHSWSVTEDSSSLHLINLPPTAYLFDAAKPNGWVLANLEEKGIRLEMRCLNKQHKEHGRVVALKWRA